MGKHNEHNNSTMEYCKLMNANFYMYNVRYMYSL